MTKVSVIVPVYNVEQYIERCARSLFEQTLDDIEYIFVNDCTPDNSMAILTKIISDYPTRTAQIKIVNHDVNKGLPAARRSGLAIATGDYIIHCDSDDWVSKDIYQKLYEEAIRSNADMVLSGYYMSDGLNDTPILISSQHRKDICAGLISCKIMHYMWNKLVRREIYDSVSAYPTFNMLEDTVISIQLALASKTFSVIDDPLYYYFTNPRGICLSAITTDKYKMMVENVKTTIYCVVNSNSGHKYQKEVRHMKGWIKMEAWPLDRKTYLSTYPEVNLYMFVDPLLSFREKLGHLTKILGIHGKFSCIMQFIR